MALWIWLNRVVAYLPDLKFLVLSPVALQVLEALQRNPAITRDKVQHML